ncbi:MAG TPA: GAF domain-containing sensor histidine kinase, partial [Candidatus Binatia bacterium]|nr:GAF domain-containing sensor histidine kinase [Candidatus Binatia bacterium]
VRTVTGEIVSLHGTVQDITERKRAGAMIQRANQTLQAIRACHEAMLRAKTESELLNEICRIIVETAGERMAWVGFAQKTHGKHVRPVAKAGFSKTYVAKARITWANSPRGRGPVGTAIRTGNICLCHNTQTDPNFAPWREYARKCGYGSVIALPLMAEKECFGALCIYAPSPEAFDGGEQELLADLANDLSFGITTLRLRAESERLENEILHSIEQEQERIGRDLHDGLCQMLVGAKFRSVYLEKLLDGSLPEAVQEAGLLEDLLNQAIEHARDLARGLNPVKNSPNGLEIALQRLADDVQVERAAGPRCFCHFPRPVRIADHKLANHLYRIAQEAVQNAVKHAACRNISITLDRQNRQIRLIVKDDGQGLPVKLKKTGMGLDNMRTRAALVGGTLEIRRRKHGGTAVTCCASPPATQQKS